MIYIVEDDASIRELEQYALQTNQYTVRGFEDGASFWAAVRETVPDLVILDVMLPDEDGYQILGRLRETAATRTVPVIMVTAKTSEIDVVKGLDHGADDYLCNPFEKRDKEAKKNQKIVDIKEIRLSLNIDTNDFNTKVGQAKKFLSKGDKVKVSIRFRGREMAHTDLGLEVQKKFAAALPEAVVEKQPKLEGRSMQMFLAPAPAKQN